MIIVIIIVTAHDVIQRPGKLRRFFSFAAMICYFKRFCRRSKGHVRCAAQSGEREMLI